MQNLPGESRSGLNRRRFIQTAGLFALAGTMGRATVRADDTETVTLPFDNGERPLVQYPQKRPLIRLTTRPPQLETPFSIFNDSVITPNDAFFVRYHLPLLPTSLDMETFRLKITGKVSTPLEFSVAEL